MMCGEEERRRGGDGCVSAISRPHLVETRLVAARARPPLRRRILLLLLRRRLCRPLRSLCSGRRRRFLPRSGGGGGGGGGGHHSVIRRGAEEGAIAAHAHAVDHLGSMRGGVDWGVWTVDCGLVVHDTHTGGAGSRVSSGATRSRWHLGYVSAISRLVAAPARQPAPPTRPPWRCADACAASPRAAATTRGRVRSAPS